MIDIIDYGDIDFDFNFIRKKQKSAFTLELPLCLENDDNLKEILLSF